MHGRHLDAADMDLYFIRLAGLGFGPLKAFSLWLCFVWSGHNERGVTARSNSLGPRRRTPYRGWFRPRDKDLAASVREVFPLRDLADSFRFVLAALEGHAGVLSVRC